MVGQKVQKLKDREGLDKSLREKLHCGLSIETS
jgi:hypothetical protein